MPRSLVLLVLLVARGAAAQSAPDTLRAPDVPLHTFAWSLAATDDWLLVGADEGGRRAARGGTAALSDPAGTVFVYRLGDGLPVLAGRLESDRLGIEDAFSWSLDVRGDVAVVGARSESPAVSGGPGGAVYIYRFDGTAWVREAKLGAADVVVSPLPRGGFGESVALGDGYLVVGAPLTPNPNNPTDDVLSGAAFVFEQVGGQWTNTATLVNSDTDSHLSEGFGGSISTVTEPGVDAIIVGAEQGLVPGSGERRGAVYVFERQGGQWVQQTRIGDPNTLVNDSFGRGLTWGGGGGLVSALSAVYPLDRTGGVWTLGAALPSSGPYPQGVARFGLTALVVGQARPPYTESDLYRYTLGGPAVEVSTSTVPASPHSVLSSVVLTAQYQFYGRATLDAASDYVLVQRTGTTAAEAPAEPLSRLALAPNPTAGATRVQFETVAPGPAHLVVVDALGRRVAERALGVLAAGPHAVALETGALPAGIYLVRVDTADGRGVQRLVRR